mmetsp:Transcript_22023/g.28961  ORF Transcript_22023/g.28961 Transcript_22023/m.28961 type:complete len:116 (-) Transcript_22023:921-1268(-)
MWSQGFDEIKRDMCLSVSLFHRIFKIACQFNNECRSKAKCVMFYHGTINHPKQVQRHEPCLLCMVFTLAFSKERTTRGCRRDVGDATISPKKCHIKLDHNHDPSGQNPEKGRACQ